jgi:hypothetical protein
MVRSGAERSFCKGEVDNSILSGSTRKLPKHGHFLADHSPFSQCSTLNRQ